LNGDEDPCDAIVLQMVAESRRVREAGALLTAGILAFVIIDAMAWAGLPHDRTQVRRSDFMEWVEHYLRTPYPEKVEWDYNGSDMYEYRCGMLHTISSQGKMIAFHDGSHHRFRPDLDATVGISIPLLYDDLWTGVARFLADARAGDHYDVVKARFSEMYRFMPFKGEESAAEPLQMGT